VILDDGAHIAAAMLPYTFFGSTSGGMPGSGE
jgi:hypothetical protein